MDGWMVWLHALLFDRNEAKLISSAMLLALESESVQ